MYYLVPNNVSITIEISFSKVEALIEEGAIESLHTYLGYQEDRITLEFVGFYVTVSSNAAVKQALLTVALKQDNPVITLERLEYLGLIKKTVEYTIE